MAILHSIMALLLFLSTPSLVPGSNVLARPADMPTEGHCQASRAVEGEPATMTFTLRADIDTTSPSFYAHLRRKTSPMSDMITCDGPHIASGEGCEIKKAYPMFQVTNHLGGNRLIVEINDMSRDLEDTYVLQTYFSNSAEPAISCTLNITAPAMGANDEGGISGGVVAAIIIALLLVLIIVLSVIFRTRINSFCQRTLKRPRQSHVPEAQDKTDSRGMDRPEKEEPEFGKTTSYESVNSPLLSEPRDEKHSLLPGNSADDDFAENTDGHPSHEPRPNTKEKEGNNEHDGQKQYASPRTKHDELSPAKTKIVQQKPVDSSHNGKRWFLASLSDEDVKTRFSFRKNKVGSFLITQDQNSPSRYTLTVQSKHKGLKSVPIDEIDAVFRVRDGGVTFHTLCDLVEDFRNHDIGEKGLKLHMPCEEEPNEEWYFGKLTQEEVEKVLSPERVVEGTFALYDSVTDEEKYTLSVILKSKESREKSKGERCDFTVQPRDDGFTISSENKSCKTLAELIDHFKKNDLTYNKTLRGKLCFACEKLLTAKDEEILKRNGPGSYFIKPYPVSKQQLLAVNTNNGPKAFTIIQNSKGFRLDDVYTYHPTRYALIQNCRRNGITMHGTDYGLLLKDCSDELKEK